jgi:hypothetical protein
MMERRNEKHIQKEDAGHLRSTCGGVVKVFEPVEEVGWLVLGLPLLGWDRHQAVRDDEQGNDHVSSGSDTSIEAPGRK